MYLCIKQLSRCLIGIVTWPLLPPRLSRLTLELIASRSRPIPDSSSPSRERSSSIELGVRMSIYTH